jgi:hypothetical protein
VTGPGGYASVYAELGSTPDATATWTAPALGGVTFTVEAALPDSYAAAGAVYTVHAADGDHVVPIDQGAAKGTWVDLGTFAFDDAHPGSVTLAASGSGYLRASAVRFVPDGPTTAPELALSTDAVTAGDTVRIDVSGLAPGELVDVELHSEPVLLGEFRADGSGELHATLRIPVASPAGTHSIVVHAAVSGTAAAELVVRAAAGAVGSGGLARTGAELGLLGWAVLALLAGIVLTTSRILRRQRVIPKESA